MAEKIVGDLEAIADGAGELLARKQAVLTKLEEEIPRIDKVETIVAIYRSDKLRQLLRTERGVFGFFGRCPDGRTRSWGKFLGMLKDRLCIFPGLWTRICWHRSGNEPDMLLSKQQLVSGGDYNTMVQLLREPRDRTHLWASWFSTTRGALYAEKTCGARKITISPP